MRNLEQEGLIQLRSPSQVQSFANKLQCVGTSGFGGFAFLVVQRSDGEVKGISKTCTFTQQDKERLRALKLWYESPTQTVPTSSHSNNNNNNGSSSGNKSKFCKTIEEMVPQAYCDVVCQVSCLHKTTIIINFCFFFKQKKCIIKLSNFFALFFFVLFSLLFFFVVLFAFHLFMLFLEN